MNTPINARAGCSPECPAPVIWLGLEPKTYCLEGSCSIQLSYGTDLKKGFREKSAAKLDIFSEISKFSGRFQMVNLI